MVHSGTLALAPGVRQSAESGRFSQVHLVQPCSAMSSERKASGAASSEVQADDTGQDSEVAQVLFALNRLDATIRGERDTLARLRGALRDMAGLLHHFKWSMRQSAKEPLDVGTLLDELEHRIDAMLGLGREIAPSSAQVPTVSGVVSQLGRGDEAPPEVAQRQGPTVSELTAMVQALSASVPAAPEAEPPQAEASATAEPATSAAALPAEPAAGAVAPPVEAVEAEPGPAPPPAEPEADDLAAFLFGPDLPAMTGDWKAQAPGPTPALPTVDLVASAQSTFREPAPATARPKASNPTPAAPAEKRASSPDDDPLAPLNAMSEWERLALFS
jgi:hypothetical protein